MKIESSFFRGLGLRHKSGLASVGATDAAIGEDEFRLAIETMSALNRAAAEAMKRAGVLLAMNSPKAVALTVDRIKLLDYGGRKPEDSRKQARSRRVAYDNTCDLSGRTP